MKYDAFVVGIELAGLTVIKEMAVAGKKLLLLDQEPKVLFGGQDR